MKYVTQNFNLEKLHQMKKKYTKLNNEIFYIKLLIKKN